MGIFSAVCATAWAGGWVGSGGCEVTHLADWPACTQRGLMGVGKSDGAIGEARDFVVESGIE